MQSEQWCTSWCQQFKVLLLRGVRERRFEAFNKLRIFQVVSVAILAGLLWWQTPTSHIEDRVSFFIPFISAYLIIGISCRNNQLLMFDNQILLLLIREKIYVLTLYFNQILEFFYFHFMWCLPSFTRRTISVILSMFKN